MSAPHAATASIPHADVPPDWATTAGDFPCPLCNYNLRGLAEPRCPECGYASTWQHLANARHFRHPYLFEHRPTPVGFARTLAAGLLPRQFWRTLTAFHAVRPVRLADYYVLSITLTLLPLLTFLAAGLYLCYEMTGAVTLAWDELPLGGILIDLALYLTWPWAMMLTLMIYRGSMWRASVRTGHIVRCVVYAWDAGAWVGVTVTAMMLYAVAASGGGIDRLVDRSRDLPAAAFMVWLVLAVVATYRLVVAYQRYLKMRRAWVAIPLAGLIVLLFYVNVLLYLTNLRIL